MLGARGNFEYENIKPAHEFDGRFVIDGRTSPLCGVKLWLPIDCHEDARIQASGSSDPSDSRQSQPLVSQGGGTVRLVSEIDPVFKLQIEADDVHISEISNKPALMVNGTTIRIDQISRLRFRRQEHRNDENDVLLNEACTYIAFFLSDLDYGTPKAIPKMDYLGNREAGVYHVKTLSMLSSAGLVKLGLERHWRWSDANQGRLVAGSFPALVMKNSELFKWGQLEEIQQIGRDACAFLSLAARHLTALHVMTSMVKRECLEEWFEPLNRQRSTTVEGACGPLVDEDQLENFFLTASTQWNNLTVHQQDAVRLAIFSINPFVTSSSEGAFLRMFSAVEGLARAWFPNVWKINKKIERLIEEFSPRISGLWPITSENKDGLDEIRNRIAHGHGMTDALKKVQSLASDHLQVWIERILLAILGCHGMGSPRDWLSGHVQGTPDELARLRSSLKDVQGSAP